jgi:hypothetical protein
MNRVTRVLSGFLFAAIVTAGLGQAGIAAQSVQPAPDPAVAEVRKMVADARKDVDSYKTAGGKADASDHPAIKWDAALWQVRDRAPQNDAGALAAAEAIWLLIRAELWDRAHARIESLGFDDRAWERVASAVYSAGVAKKDLPSAIGTLSRAAESTTKPSIKSAALLALGRAHRRQGDSAAATRSLEAAKAAAPGTPPAEEADGILYEIAHLSVGLPAPAISARARNGRTVNLAALRGKPVVLVFWGTT